MNPNQPKPVAPIGGTFEMAGYIFECVGHDVDRHGNTIERPGKRLGKAPKAPKQNKRTGHSVAGTPTLSTVTATTAEPSPPLTPAVPRQRKARRTPAQRYEYRRFRQQRPPDLKIVNEPWGAGQWAALIVVLALIVAGLWFYSVGSEQQKWRDIEGAARAVQHK
jgi:hypothetical protein